MIDPKSIDIFALPWLPIEVRSTFPRVPAIYFAMGSGSNLLYIGMTHDLKTRWANHHRYEELREREVEKIAYYFPNLRRSIPVDRDELARLEKYYICKFDPPLNKRLRGKGGDKLLGSSIEELLKQSPIWSCIVSEPYCRDSPQVKQFYLWAVEHKQILKHATKLNVSVSEVETLNKFLKFFLNYETEYVRYAGSQGQQQRFYRITNFDLPKGKTTIKKNLILPKKTIKLRPQSRE